MQPFLKSHAALALDCQTTGANAAKHHLLEVGWVPVGSLLDERRLAPTAYLVKLPERAVLPPVVGKLTGIGEEDLGAAATPEQVWQRLVDAAAALPATSHISEAVTLIHYARFERPFLQRLHAGCGEGQPFPLHIVCTHAIARRLLPHLPSCSLRALAGYFGHALDSHKRAGCHALATAVIWKHLVGLLAARGIRKWPDLEEWLGRPPPSGRIRKQFPMPRSLRLKAPDHPGVYRLCRANGDLLYVGKACSLKRRINSYFQNSRRHGAHILEMLTQARTLDYDLTPTALEAALLEADFIKQTAPPYNIRLKPRETGPAFFSDDFQSAGAADNTDYAIGPLPAERSLKAFGFIVAQCGRTDRDLPTDTEGLAAALAIPERCLPTPAALAKGLQVYRANCVCGDDLAHTGRQLLKRGLILWRRRQIRDDGLTAEDDHLAPEDGGEKEWDTEAVLAMLDGIVCRASRLVRRGRWLQMLSNTALRWHTPNGKVSPERTLLICNGRVRAVNQDHEEKGLTALAPAAASRTARRKIFASAATYDRLSVLTSELRRLLAEDRRVALAPAVGAPFGNRGLARLLNLL